MESQEKGKLMFSPFRIFLIGLLSILLVVSISFAFFTYYFSDKILPNVYAAGIYIGGKTETEAKKILSEKLIIPESITLQSQDKTTELSLKELEVSYNIDQTVANAKNYYTKGSFFENSLAELSSLSHDVSIPLISEIDEEKLDEFLQITSTSQNEAPQYPSLTLSAQEITVNSGKAGKELNLKIAREQILNKIRNYQFTPLVLSYTTVDPALTEAEANEYKQKAQKLVGKTITLTYDYQTVNLKDQKLLDLVGAKTPLHEQNFARFLKNDISPVFNRPPQNALFKYENNKVQEFLPAKKGTAVNENELKDKLKEKITQLITNEDKEATIEVPVQEAAPQITTQEVNDLGINELIGRGSSTFKGSIPNRVFNIGHASGKLNGILVPPNTVFSFNEAVGDISKLTGYKEAYVIQNGKTVLGDGGGVCQVSTTLFRAAMNAGLPIVNRRAHAYRVGYYEQDSGPGLDATIYVPSTDFRFKNDTPGTILIQTQFDPKAMTLAFEIYGTKDGRTATVSKPVITNQVAPPPDLYIDDPTLPAGKITQVEYRAMGAKVSFDYKVTRNNETLFEETFVSNYRPWQAVYRRGTGPAQTS